MTDNAAPSRDPANSSGDVPGAMREIFAKFLQSSVDDMLPAKIVAYDRDTNRAIIKPLIAMVATNGANISRNQLASIPVINIGGGGCILSFNMVPGDLGWIKANDRDIADFLKRYSESVPSTKRVHDFNNGLFIPDVMTGYSINVEDAENAVLQTLDGTVRVSLFPDKLKLTAPTVEVNATTNHLINTPVYEVNASVSHTINTQVSAINATVSHTVNTPLSVINATVSHAINTLISTIGAVTSHIVTSPIIGLLGVFTNNNVNVGETHVHPQANDSADDSQANTGAPE